MAFLNIVGFETGDTLEAHSTNGARVSIVTDIVRSGSYALKVNPNGIGQNSYVVGAYNSSNGTTDNTSTDATTFWSGYFRFVALPSGDGSQIAGMGNGTGSIDFKLTCDIDGSIKGVGATTSGVAKVVVTGVWYRVDVVFVQNGASSIAIDGGPAQSFTAGNAAANFRVYLGNESLTAYTYDMRWDDVAWDDATLPGDGHINMLIPIGDGTDQTGYTGGTGSTFTEVDDPAVNDGDTTTWSSGTNNDVRGVTLTSAANGGVTSTIKVVKGFNIKKNAAATIHGVRVRSGSSVVDVNNTAAINAAYVLRSNFQATDPATSLAWTIAGINTLQVACRHGNDADADTVTAMGAMVLSTGTPAPGGGGGQGGKGGGGGKPGGGGNGNGNNGGGNGKGSPLRGVIGNRRLRRRGLVSI